MRFQLRSILLIVTLIAVFLALLTYRANRHLQRRNALSQISRLGARVAFVGGSEFEPPPPNSVFAELRCWFNDAIRPRTPWKIMFANYRGFTTSVTDDDLPLLISAIENLPNVVEVRFLGADVTRDTVVGLRREFPDVNISGPMTKPRREISDEQRLQRELRITREHYERKGWDEKELHELLEEFRRDWYELRKSYALHRGAE